MNQIEALAFDIGGTVFDWQTPVRAAIRSLAQQRAARIDDHEFALAWRAGMFGVLEQVREGNLPWMNADRMHRRVLDDLAEKYPSLHLSETDRDELNRIWHQLKAWPDFPDALVSLRQHYKAIVLTVLSWSVAVDCSRGAGLCWDGILSCEFLGHYKPHREVYLAGARLLGLQPHQVVMVASHAVDLRAAKTAGLRTAYVQPKCDEPDFPGFTTASPDEFDLCARDFTDLAQRLCP